MNLYSQIISVSPETNGFLGFPPSNIGGSTYSNGIHKFIFDPWAPHFSFLFIFPERNIPYLSSKVTVRGVPVQSCCDTEAGMGAHGGEYRPQNARPELTVLALPRKDVFLNIHFS